MRLETDNLVLDLQTPAEVLQWVSTLPENVSKELSNEWLARVRLASKPDPWCCGFKISTKASGEEVGSCAFKGPPDNVGMVEIAYGIDQPYRCRGYATEAARALVEFAATNEKVAVVRANTKHNNVASERVLLKVEFTLRGEFVEPDDGLVNRWERDLETNSR